MIMEQIKVQHYELPKVAIERLKTLKAYNPEFKENNVVELGYLGVRVCIAKLGDNVYLVETMRFNRSEQNWDDFSKFQFVCWEVAIEFVKQFCAHPTRKEDVIVDMATRIMKLHKFHRWAEWALFGDHSKFFEIKNTGSTLNITASSYDIKITVSAESVHISNRNKSKVLFSDECHRPQLITFKGSSVLINDELFLDNKPL